MSYMWKVIKLPTGEHAQLVPYDKQNKCACSSGCKSTKNPIQIQYCGKDCQAGNCTHAVQQLGQSVGRPMCACGNCRCDQAVYNENGVWFSKCNACYNGYHAPH